MTFDMASSSTKTKVPFWHEMSRSRTDRYLKCMGRDIHLVPIQFLLTEPEMLRNYGGRVLLFNTNYERTREALRTARETPNGYILVSENIHLGALEACFNLDANTWDFPYTPETTLPRDIGEHGLEEAIHILHYYSQVVHRQEMTIGQLPAAHREVLRDIEDHYYRHLRYPGAPGGTEEERTAGDRISLAHKMTAEDAAIGEIVREVFMKVNKSRLGGKSHAEDSTSSCDAIDIIYNTSTGQRTTTSRFGTTSEGEGREETQASSSEIAGAITETPKCRYTGKGINRTSSA